MAALASEGENREDLLENSDDELVIHSADLRQLAAVADVELRKLVAFESVERVHHSEVEGDDSRDLANVNDSEPLAPVSVAEQATLDVEDVKDEKGVSDQEVKGVLLLLLLEVAIEFSFLEVGASNSLDVASLSAAFELAFLLLLLGLPVEASFLLLHSVDQVVEREGDSVSASVERSSSSAELLAFLAVEHEGDPTAVGVAAERSPFEGSLGVIDRLEKGRRGFPFPVGWKGFG